MKQLLLLLFISNALVSQTICETSQDITNDLNVISVKKCLIQKTDSNLLSDKNRKVISQTTSSKRFLKVRKVRSKEKALGVNSSITNYGLVSKKGNNKVEIEALLAYPKKIISVESFKTIDVIPAFRKCGKGNITKKEMKTCFFDEITSFVNNNINYPEEAIDAGVNGEITIKFIIDTKGDVSNIIVTGDKNSRSLKEEVIDLIYQLPKFKPGVKNGEKVPVSFEFSLNFTL